MRLLLQTLRLSIYSLLLHKMRSGLAVLGILIGIMAVIWLVAMGRGVSYQAQKQIEDLGARNIIVRSVKPAQEGSASQQSGLFMMYGILRDDFKRILTEPENSLIKQYKALLNTEGVTLDFQDDSIDALADLSAEINQTVENIGARRLATVMERLLEEISFTAPDRGGETITITAAKVHEDVGELAKDADLSRFIL